MISDTSLRYLFVIYAISRTKMVVSSMEVARALDVTKPSVVRVLESLMRRGFVVKERYGKIYLTDRGAFVVHYYQQILDQILAQFPALPFPVDDTQREIAACAMAAALPDEDFRQKYASVIEASESQTV